MKKWARTLLAFCVATPSFAGVGSADLIALDFDEESRARMNIADTSFEALRDTDALHKHMADIADPDIRVLIETINELLHRGLRAEELTDSELTSYVNEVNLLASALKMSGKGEEIRDLAKQVKRLPQDPTPNDGPDCTCGYRLNAQECYNDNVPPDAPTWPCFSCAGCNLEYLACVASCIV